MTDKEFYERWQKFMCDNMELSRNGIQTLVNLMS